MSNVNNNLWADKAILKNLLDGLKKSMPHVDIVVDSFCIFEERRYSPSLDTFKDCQSISFEGTVYYRGILVECLDESIDCTEKAFNEYFTEISNLLLKEDKRPELCPGVDVYFGAYDKSQRNKLVKYKIVEKIKAYTTSEAINFLVLKNAKGELSIEYSDLVYTIGE
jgi:hypothetical protein